MASLTSNTRVQWQSGVVLDTEITNVAVTRVRAHTHTHRHVVTSTMSASRSNPTRSIICLQKQDPSE